MHISELIAEQQLDELSLAGVGKGIGKLAGGYGQAVGNVQGAWQGAQDVYNQNRDRVAKVAQRNVSRAGGYKTPRSATTSPTVQGQTPPAPQTTQPNQGQSLDLDQLKQQRAAQQAQGQADQQQAIQQMKSTVQANQNFNVSDNEIKQAAVDAKAKSPALQNNAERMALKIAAGKGIHVEFHSRFLDRML